MMAYLVTNTVNGKGYIGITTKPKIRWKKHLAAAQDASGKNAFALHRAIAKYGQRAFRFETIACAKSYADLFSIERMLIAQHGTFRPGGYNLTLGGEGGFGMKMTDQGRENIRRAKIGVPASEEARASLVAAWKNPRSPISKEARKRAGDSNRGRKRTPEQCSRISAGKTGRKLSDAGRIKRNATRQTAEFRQKMSIALTGRKFSKEGLESARRGHQNPERNKKISDALRGRPLSEEHKALLRGRKRSDESRKRMSEGRCRARLERAIAAQENTCSPM